VHTGIDHRGLMTYGCGRGTQTVESYHSESNEFLNSDKLREEAAKLGCLLGDLGWNVKRR
jgi:hypothetical protein